MANKSPVQIMLEEYGCNTTDDRRAALKEIIQEITLLALDRAKFFNQAAFYGGTALRIFHNLDRFSETLDFSLVEPNQDFDLNGYLDVIRDELMAYGFDMEVSLKTKSRDSAVQSAFIKGGTLIHLVKIASLEPPVSGVPSNELLTVKLEIDTDPPAGAGYEFKYRLEPVPYSVRLYDPQSLFAGKLHALLCRNWKQRVKGRDFYDYVWYLKKGIPVNLKHLEARMRQSGHWQSESPLGYSELLEALEARFNILDFDKVKADVIPFIKDSSVVRLWGMEFFTAVTRDRLKVQ
jgi:predicted nucleotidyltransferase component of viral defense system